MSQEEKFARLLQEFERVGVDPNTISAGLAVSQPEALRVLSVLPDGAGPAAFLRQLRAATAPGAVVVERAGSVDSEDGPDSSSAISRSV